MGLFERLIGNHDPSLSPQAALLLAALTMVTADGVVDDNELAIIKRLDGSGRTDAWDLAVKTWKAKSAPGCVALVAETLSLEQQEATMANLIDIAMADGVLAGQEQTLLDEYVEAFDVSIKVIESMVDVVSIKNNKGLFQ